MENLEKNVNLDPESGSEVVFSGENKREFDNIDDTRQYIISSLELEGGEVDPGLLEFVTLYKNPADQETIEDAREGGYEYNEDRTFFMSYDGQRIRGLEVKLYSTINPKQGTERLEYVVKAS